MLLALQDKKTCKSTHVLNVNYIFLYYLHIACHVIHVGMTPMFSTGPCYLCMHDRYIQLKVCIIPIPIILRAYTCRITLICKSKLIILEKCCSSPPSAIYMKLSWHAVCQILSCNQCFLKGYDS